jgi:uncharacterized protein
MSLLFNDLLAGSAVGLVGGVTAGLLGVSPGGGLVVFSVLLLGAEQHLAQGISLVAQIPPTSVAGIRRYWAKGGRVSLRWLVPLTIGFLAGGVAGALAAGSVGGSVLRWSYVGYLAALDALLIFRPQPSATTPNHDVQRIHWALLLGVGVIAGVSSGFLGIGGGLAVTVCLSAGLKVPQHQAQLVSLVLGIIPTTIPAAWVYWHQGWLVSWPIIGGVLLGLWAGTDLGASIANRLGNTALRRVLIGVVSTMAIYMAYKAQT